MLLPYAEELALDACVKLILWISVPVLLYSLISCKSSLLFDHMVVITIVCSHLCVREFGCFSVFINVCALICSFLLLQDLITFEQALAV